jgi:gas vesicle protein
MSDWLKALAPLLGTALGGPLGGAAATFIADKLGLESKTLESVTEVLNSGKMSPEQISQIKMAEVDFKKFMADHEIKLEQISADDRKSARDMQIASRSTTPAVLTYLITLGFFGVLTVMLFYPETKESAPLMIMLGALGTAWTGSCAYWFGKNSGSDRTKELLAQATIK